MVVSEAMGDGNWFRGRLVEDPAIYLELCFGEGAPFPYTDLSYILAIRSRSTCPVMEFQCGYLAHRPTDKEWGMLILPLIQAIGTYRPFRIVKSMFDA